MALAIVNDELWSFIAVAALFAAVFSIASTARSPAWNGAIGSLAGWTVAMAVGLTEEISGYWSHTGSQPYFEDGTLWVLVFAPIYATAFFAIPLAAMGAVIGLCVPLVARLIARCRTQQCAQPSDDVDTTPARIG